MAEKKEEVKKVEAVYNLTRVEMLPRTMMASEAALLGSLNIKPWRRWITPSMQ